MSKVSLPEEGIGAIIKTVIRFVPDSCSPAAGESSMDVNASIIDQYVRKIAAVYPSELVQRGRDNDERRRSNAFCLLCLKTLLALDEEQALRCLTDGGKDGGVDAIHFDEVIEGEFVVTLFQAKYHPDLAGDRAIKSDPVIKLINTINAIFDPDISLTGMEHIKPPVEEIRSMIRDGALPQIRAVLCNNGQRWESDAEMRIAQSGLTASGQVSFEHLNHVRLVDLLRPQARIDETLRLNGAAVVDSFNFRRVLLGKVPVAQIQELFAKHGDSLFDQNIRRYLGWSNRVNSGMIQTLEDDDDRQNFYFYNNGITIICHKFSYNALQAKDWSVKVNDMQIINGGQTCQSIAHAIEAHPHADYSQSFVLARIYELEEDDKSLVYRITSATNSQSPIELRDLRSNDVEQRRLKTDLDLLGYDYKSKRDNTNATPRTIPSSVAAEAVLAIWRRKPHMAKFATTKLFDQFYPEIFTQDLTGAQVAMAVLLYRAMHNERRKPTRPNPPYFLPYSSHHLAMIVGQLLTKQMKLKPSEISHLNFQTVFDSWQTRQTTLYEQAVQVVEASLNDLAVSAETNLQRVAAQFRRGDLLQLVNDRIAHWPAT